jgi:hypothetical protein
MAKGWIAGLRHVAVVIAYVLGYELLRSFTVSHWILTAGLRLSCLLLTPYRYWPALAVGELLPLAYLGYDCYDQFGLAWSIAAAIPPVVLGMPIVW